MTYAEVAVNSPGSRSAFSYAVPSGLNVWAGQAVWVPFCSRVGQGIVLLLSDEPSVAQTREITGIVTDCPLLSPIQIRLAQWMSEHYLAPLFDALALMLPPGLERRTTACFQLTDAKADLSLTAEQRQVLHIIGKKKKISLPELEKSIGRSKARQITDQLLDRQLIVKTLEPEKARTNPKTLPFVKLIANSERIAAEQARLDST